MAVVNQINIPPVLVTGADGPGRPRRRRPTPRRGRAGPRPHPSLRGGGDAAGEGRRLHRRPHRARDTRPGIEWRRCGVFLVWTAPPQTAAAVVERLAAHVRRVVFLSSPHQTPHPFFQQPNPIAVLHADIERLIAATGLESTIIRPGMLASNSLAWWAPAIRAGEAVRWPYGAAETAPVDDRDIAAVAARTLHQDGYAGGDYVLTGPESLTQAAQIGVIGDALGRRIPFEEMTPDEFRNLSQGTAPSSVVDMLLAAWSAAVGQPAYITTAVADILGTAPRTFRQCAADHAAAFTEGSQGS